MGLAGECIRELRTKVAEWISIVEVPGSGGRDNLVRHSLRRRNLQSCRWLKRIRDFYMEGLDLGLAFDELANPAVYGMIRSSCRSLCH
jgi:hypothetical protein